MTALFLSPHLDDVAFSCGGTVAQLATMGWRTALVTVFTGSVAVPQGFALACQTDKGLAPTVDYMALRRTEDAEAAKVLGVTSVTHWAFKEAPHRGYHSAAELFAGTHPKDTIWEDLVAPLKALLEVEKPQIVYLPQGIGGHIDHIQLIRAFLACEWDGQTRWYRDTPYIIRNPAAIQSKEVPENGHAAGVALSEVDLEKKIAACEAYTTQLGFQFGGISGVRSQLLKLAQSEAMNVGQTGLAEVFWETSSRVEA